MWPALIAAGASLAGSYLNRPRGQGGADAAMPYLNRVPQYGYDAYNPFIKQGQEADQQLLPQYGAMNSDPVQYLNQILGQYKPSAGYQYREDRNLRQAHNTAAAGGYVGTQNDIENRTGITNGLMSQDIQEFLANVLGIKGTGIAGLENRAGRGFEAAGSLADYLGGASGAQGQAAYSGRAQKEANRANMLNSLLGTVASTTGAYYGSKAPTPTSGGNTFNPLRTTYQAPINQPRSATAAASPLFGGGGITGRRGMF